MLRIGLTLYLMLAMLAGSALCCCMAEQLRAVFARTSKQGTRAPCCNHQESTRPSQQRALQQCPDKKDHSDRSECPCQGHRCQETALAALESSPAKQFQSRLSLLGPTELLAALPFALAVSSERECRPPKESMPLPFLTAQDILRTLHMLRC